MRIALVSQEYPPDTAHGGIASQTYQKAHRLAELGHSVHVISRGGESSALSRKDGAVEVTRLPLFDPPFVAYTEVADWLTHSCQIAAALSRLNESSPIDLIDFPEYGGEGYVHLLNQTEYNRIPSVVQLHGPLVMLAHEIGWPEVDSEFYRIGTQMEGTCVRLADAVYSSSACSADWASRSYGRPRTEIEIIHAGVDTNHFRPGLAPKEERPTIIFVGKVARNKGVELLVDASIALSRDHADLLLRIAGRHVGSLAHDLSDRASAAGHPDLVELLGPLDHEELAEQLCRAHVFAAPSAYEGGPGLVYLEAMGCGLPVVAGAGSGADEVVKHDVNGLLVPPGDLGALVEALARLLQDEKLRGSIAEAGRAYVVEEADSRICAKRLEAFYTCVVESGVAR